MERLFVTAAFTFLASHAFAGEFSAADIAPLPQDHCAQKWDSNFVMREFCEDNRYEALGKLIARGSIRID
ncbi:hypothetical protein BIWAKO_06954 [Bosea sp. BIWAKO-01]|nr:hypothetical protein BIWAKO_06954 [Bosea sp. BIWAKO-01]